MNKSRNLTEMGDFYASTILNEKKSTFPGPDTFKVQKDKKVTPTEVLGTRAYVQSDSGPDHKGAETLFKPEVKSKMKKDDERSVFSGERFTEENPEYTASTKKTEKAEKKGKMAKESINNFMTKSIFDKLYEAVINEENLPGDEIEAHDAEALDLPAGDKEGEVTITLDRELAQKLHDVLMDVLGAHEGEPEGTEEGEAEDAEDNEEAHLEATELEELPNTRGQEHTKVSKGSNTVKDSWSTHNIDGTEGDGKIKDGIDAEGTPEGHALVNAKKGHPTPVTGKANVVASRVTKNVGKVAFTK